MMMVIMNDGNDRMMVVIMNDGDDNNVHDDNNDCNNNLGLSSDGVSFPLSPRLLFVSNLVRPDMLKVNISS